MTGDVGKIRFPDRARQIKDYTGLKFERNITPSDIDGAMDFGGELFVFLEYKMTGCQMPGGQRRFLASMCDAINTSKDAVVLVAEHNTPIGEEIDCANAAVVEFRCKWADGWHMVPESMTMNVRSAIERVYDKVFITPF